MASKDYSAIESQMMFILIIFTLTTEAPLVQVAAQPEPALTTLPEYETYLI